MTHQIKEERRLHQYFWMTPNTVNYKYDLTPYAFRLYSHLKCVAGEDGECWQSTKTMADICKMSAGSISNAKKELVEAGLIRIAHKPRPQGGKPYHEITIIDIWDENLKENRPSSPHEFANSPHELASSPGEIKKTPVIRPQEEESPLCESEKQTARETVAQVHKGLRMTDEHMQMVNRMIYDCGPERTLHALTRSHAKWCESETKEGKRYNPGNPGWIEWAFEACKEPLLQQQSDGGYDV